MRRVKKNSNYRTLVARGTYNPNNRINLPTSNVPEVGVAVYQSGEKKAIGMQLLVPGRSEVDSRTTTEIVLNGVQARQIYETLAAFYGDNR